VVVATPQAGDTNWAGSGGTSGTKLNTTLNALDTAITAETSARTSADNALDARLDAIEAKATVSNVQNTAGTTTSTSYTATLTGGTTCSLTFVAPPSGSVMIHNTCETKNNTNPELSLCTFEVRAGSTVGSGTVVIAASDDEAVFSTDDVRFGAARLLTGLTPGSTYNIRQLFRVTASTGTFSRKSLIVRPD
jgi:hypothetical protein